MVLIDKYMRIDLNQKGGTITYDATDWLAGQDTTSGGNDGRMLGNGFAFSEKVDPLRNLGYISPSYNIASVTNNSSVTSLVRNGVLKDQVAYMIAGAGVGSGGGIVQSMSSPLAGTIDTTAPFPHTIDHAHANETGSDIVNYTANVSGTSTLLAFFSFSDDTDWDVGIYNYTADTFNDDYMSTIPASPLASPYLTGGKSAPHPLIVGDDDILYIGDRNFLHAYDGATGTDGTFYPAVLTLPQGWIITCFCKTNDQKLLIGAYYSASGNLLDDFYLGSAKVYKWNYLDLDYDYAYDLQDNYISELVNWNDTIAAFTSGRRTQTETGTKKLQALVGSGFKVIQSYSTGVLPIRGGVLVLGSDLYWNGGLIYFYAKNPFGENYIFGNISGNSAGVAGMCRSFTGLFNLHYSNGTAAAGFGVQYTLENYTTASAYGKVATPTFPERKRGRLKKVDIYFKDTISGATGRTFALNTTLDKGSTVTYTAINTVTNLKVEVIDFKPDGTPLGDFTTLQPEFVWASGSGTPSTAPIVQKVVYFFEYTDINQGLQT